MYEVLINLMYENLFFTCTKFILVSVRKFIFLLLDFLFFLFTNFFVRSLRKISGKGVYIYQGAFFRFPVISITFFLIWQAIQKTYYTFNKTTLRNHNL